MNDEKIITLLRKGEHSGALDRLYKGYPPIRKFILTHGGTEEDAKDLFQEALIIFCEKAVRPDFKLTARISTYVFSVCKYLWKDRLEKVNRYTYTSNFEPEADISEVVDEYQEEQKYRYLDQVLSGIGDQCRKLLEAYYFYKKSMTEISELFGYASPGSAKNQKYKCLDKAKRLAKKENLYHNETEA